MSSESGAGRLDRRAVVVLAIVMFLLVAAGVLAAVVVGRDRSVSDNGLRGSITDSDSDLLGTETGDYVAAVEVAMPSGLGDPAAVDLPSLDDELFSWLDTDGRQMTSFLRAVVPLWSDGRDSCTVVAGELSQIGSPSEIEEIAQGAPDPVAADVLGGVFRSAARLLLACGDGAGAENFEARRAELAWQWALAVRVIEASGGAG